MKLDIARNGIVRRLENERVALVRPDPKGGPWSEVEVPEELADRYRLTTGDIVEGVVEPLELPDSEPAIPADEELWDYDERDEPAAVRGERPPVWLATLVSPTARLIRVRSVNGLAAGECLDRPEPRMKRTALEREPVGRMVPLGVRAGNVTGRMLDFAAPFGIGYAGVVQGPHGAGLTRTLRAVLDGFAAHVPDAAALVLLLRARSEEITDWQRRFPEADVVVCPGPHSGMTPHQTVELATLTLEAAKRTSELGRDVLLIVDSLTGLWGAMLESEEADSQREADRSWSRHRIREWMQSAGRFSEEGILGRGLGGSLTLVGAVWRQAVNTEAEEEGEVHPHLRLYEHIVHDAGWRVSLSRELAQKRLFPAVDPLAGYSEREEALVGSAWLPISEARQALRPLDVVERWSAASASAEEAGSLAEMADLILRAQR